MEKMEKIGIYKPFKKVFFFDDKEDTAAWSYEVTSVAKIFAERGHQVTMLSDTDLNKGTYHPKIHAGSIDEVKKFDRIICFSGCFDRSDREEADLAKMRTMTDRLDFLLTDLRLLPKDVNVFDNVFTQATRDLSALINYKKKTVYGGVAEFILYDYKQKPLVNTLKNKSIEYYFGGTERDRIDDFIEYVWRPNTLITGKSDTLLLNNKVNRYEYMNLLDSTKYSIVIADKRYNENCFLTPRHYEYVMHDIVSFVDSKWDKDGLIVRNNDWRRVEDYKELITKMQYLNAHFDEYLAILESQRREIKPEFVNGDYVYDLLNRKL